MSSRFNSPPASAFALLPPPCFFFGSTVLDGKGGGEEVAQSFLLACVWRGYGEQRQRESEGKKRWDKLAFV